MKEKEIYLLYETDQWHSTQSQVLIGVFSSMNKLLAALQDSHLSDWQIDEIEQQYQTCWDENCNGMNLIVHTAILNEYAYRSCKRGN